MICNDYNKNFVEYFLVIGILVNERFAVNKIHCIEERKEQKGLYLEGYYIIPIECWEYENKSSCYEAVVVV